MHIHSSRFDAKELIPALLFIAVGAFFLFNAVFIIGFGDDGGAGSAMFATIVSCLLIAIGLVLLVRSLSFPPAGISLLAPLPLAAILASPLVFGFTVRPLGLLPSLLLCLACASLADPSMPLRRRVIVIAAITVLCLLVFRVGLRLPFPLVTGWDF